MPGASGHPVLILTGAPGTGKTTTASVLAERASTGVHLETDVFFRFIRGGFVPPWRPESRGQNEVAMAIAAEAAAGYAAAGYFTVVEGIVLPRWFLAPMRDALNAAGFEVVYVVLRAPLSLCLERVECRDGAVEREAVSKLWSEFGNLGEFEAHAIDVAAAEPDSAAGTVEDLIVKGSHLV